MAGHIFRCGKRVCVEGALVAETHCFLCAGIYVNVDVFFLLRGNRYGVEICGLWFEMCELLFVNCYW